MLGGHVRHTCGEVLGGQVGAAKSSPRRLPSQPVESGVDGVHGLRVRLDGPPKPLNAVEENAASPGRYCV